MRWPEGGMHRLRALAGAVAPLAAILLLLAAVGAPLHCLGVYAAPENPDSGLCHADPASIPDGKGGGDVHQAAGACALCPLPPLLAADGPDPAAQALRWHDLVLRPPAPVEAPDLAAFAPGQPRAPPPA